MSKHIKTIPDSVTLEKLGTKITVSVRRSNKAKRLAIRIRRQQAELVLPNNDFTSAYNFLLSKESWVRNKLESLPKPIDIDSSMLPIFGKKHQLRYVSSNTTKVQIHKDIISIYSSDTQRKQLIIDFLTDLLLVEVNALTEKLSKQEKLYFSQIKIVNTKTSWGTCSSNKTLSFNWRLALAPLEVTHYVVVHEMCHLLEMNHSKRFWALVSNLCADYQDHKLWLKLNTPRLQQYLQ